MKRTWLIVAFALCLAATAAFSALHENIGPGGDQHKTFVTKARSGRYSLIQKPAHLKSCDEEGGWPCYQTTVHFRDKSKPDQVLPEVGLAKQTSYQMPAEYVISPDEHWFVRDQHLFAGCNILVLYKVEPDGKIREQQSDLVDLGLKCVLEDLHRANKTQLLSDGFFHFSGEDVTWDRTSGAFRFKLFARPDPPDPSVRDCTVRYDIRTGKVTHGKIPSAIQGLAKAWKRCPSARPFAEASDLFGRGSDRKIPKEKIPPKMQSRTSNNNRIRRQNGVFKHDILASTSR